MARIFWPTNFGGVLIMTGVVHNWEFHRKMKNLIDCDENKVKIAKLEKDKKHVESQIDALAKKKNDIDTNISRLCWDIADAKIDMTTTDIILVHTSNYTEAEVVKTCRFIRPPTQLVRVTIKNKKIAPCFPGICMSDGKYWMYLPPWKSVIWNIYNNNEDFCAAYEIKSFNGSGTITCIGCNLKNQASCYIKHKDESVIFKEWYCIDRFENMGMCISCYISMKQHLSTTSFHETIQKMYFEYMHYKKTLRLLLLAHTRIADNVFHIFNIGRDVFKIILRAVFPASFLVIK